MGRIMTSRSRDSITMFARSELWRRPECDSSGFDLVGNERVEVVASPIGKSCDRVQWATTLLCAAIGDSDLIPPTASLADPTADGSIESVTLNAGGISTLPLR